MDQREEIARVLKNNKPDLLARYRLTSIGIFGSFNRQDFTEKSDIDILIDYEEQIGIEFVDLADELERLLNKNVDLVSRKGIKPGYFKEIEKDLVYV